MNPYFTVNDSEHFTFYRIPSIRRRNCCISDTKRSAACLQNWMQPTLSCAAVRGRARPTAST